MYEYDEKELFFVIHMIISKTMDGVYFYFSLFTQFSINNRKKCILLTYFSFEIYKQQGWKKYESLTQSHIVTFFFVLSHSCTLSIRKNIRIVQFFVWFMNDRVSLRVTCETLRVTCETLRVTCDTLSFTNHAKN